MMKIPKTTLVLVADGRVALFLRNHGDALRPSLQLEREIRAESNPLTHVQGAGRPGRVYESGGTRRSAVEGPDLHDRAEATFARKVAAELARSRPEGSTDPIIIVAPPRMLSHLRREFSRSVAESVLAELDKDLTKHTVTEIEALLAAA